VTAAKPPAKKWRVGETGKSDLDSARPYSSQNKAYEAVRAGGVPATVWHYESARGNWVLYERLDADGDPA
jgi:hypothetical protein